MKTEDAADTASVFTFEVVVIVPMVRRTLQRRDLLGLVSAIGRRDPRAGAEATRLLAEEGLDALLDAPAAVAAVQGGAEGPGAVSLPLLWYVPIRYRLVGVGETDLSLADYAASVCVHFTEQRATRVGGRPSHPTLAERWQSIRNLGVATVARAERAADSAAVALWFSACFPSWVERGGRGGVRASVAFARDSYAEAARGLVIGYPEAAALSARMVVQAGVVRDAIAAAATEYLGPDAGDTARRIARYLRRLNIQN